MKKKISIILIGLITILALILTGCYVNVEVEKLVYGEGFVAQIDCFQGSTDPHRVRITNSSGETLKVYYDITETNDASYDSVSEPTWSSVTTNISVNNNDVQEIQTNLGDSSSNYACVWMKAQSSDGKKYIIFSVFLSKADNMEYDVTIKKGK